MVKVQTIKSTPDGVELVNHVSEGQVSPFDIVLLDETSGSLEPLSINMSIRLSPDFVERLRKVLTGLDHREHASKAESKEEAFAEGVLLGSEIVFYMCEPRTE